MIKKAIISVSDKTGIVDFAKRLEKLGIGIISTGGTEKTLKQQGVLVTNISEVTGFPECLDGRVKTLHPKIHAGILAVRDNKEHMKKLEELGIETIDMVVVNLYPFKQTIMKDDVTLKEAMENIDIGGPSMLRAAAKNYKGVVAIIDPADYEKVLDEIEQNGDVSYETRLYLAFKVFNHTAAYDALIADYLKKISGVDYYTDKLTFTFEKAQELRYGENPHQKAAFYKEPLPVKGSIVSAKQLHGKELSFNNINDANAALNMIKEFKLPTCVAVKHLNPCGIGSAENIFEAFCKAYECDPVSIFGGIIAFNRVVDLSTASKINKMFIEIVIAPGFTDEAFDVLKSKKNIRLMQLDCISSQIKDDHDIKKVEGGLLVQDQDHDDFSELQYVTERKPSDSEMESLLFGLKVVKHVKSNAIVLAKDNMTIGIGAGQVNRIWPTENAIKQAGDKAAGSCLASDAFFPFPDVVEAAAKAKVTAIIQPGGSVKDKESIDACNKYNIAMVFTGVRHFRH